jgi:hypothetical protein
MKTKTPVVMAAVGLLLLAGCSKATGEDRSDSVGAGRLPDTTQDATHVDLYRNADGVPTVILFCIGTMRFYSSPSSLGGSSSRTYITPALLRLPEQDAVCGGRPQ